MVKDFPKYSRRKFLSTLGMLAGYYALSSPGCKDDNSFYQEKKEKLKKESKQEFSDPDVLWKQKVTIPPYLASTSGNHPPAAEEYTVVMSDKSQWYATWQLIPSMFGYKYYQQDWYKNGGLEKRIRMLMSDDGDVTVAEGIIQPNDMETTPFLEESVSLGESSVWYEYSTTHIDGPGGFYFNSDKNKGEAKQWLDYRNKKRCEAIELFYYAVGEHNENIKKKHSK